ncbi:MAG: GNAT family N-acetyltransferase [Muribaculaceae bacterium]|nr:GNAT family N-acetyltransferase [Muribaculaceae bacterium]
MNIRRAEEKDIDDIMRLLLQVGDIHADGRPDIFIKGMTKYDEKDLLEILHNDATPVFVATDSDDTLLGYCFCIVQDHSGHVNLHPIKTLYIDDLCVDSEKRGLHVGKRLFEFVKDYARENGFYNVTLNVWSCNPGAKAFYKALGMTEMKSVMETLVQRDA